MTLRACLPRGKINPMSTTMKLETWASYTLRRDVGVQESATATGYGSRQQYSKQSRAGKLPLDRIERALKYWADEAAELGIELNLTDALVEMGYLPAPTQDFRHAPTATTTASRTGRTTKKGTRRDLTDYGR